ncbi:hypothetical protein C0J52_27326 [Blattella germanica]|nr:hypothetical protein C0J52_27326 [Blattella germanica]
MQRRNPPSLQSLGCGACQLPIKRLCKKVVELPLNYEYNPAQWKAHLDQVNKKLQDVQKYISKLDDNCQQIIGTDVLLYIDEVISNFRYKAYTVKDEYLKLCILLTRSMLFSSIEKINTEAMMTIYTKQALIISIHRLQNLSCLKLPSEREFATLRKTVAQSIKYLPLLTYFENCVNCTDLILNEIGLHCFLIEHIYVRMSLGVSFNSISGILPLVNLKYLDLYDTSMSETGYKIILKMKPRIQNFSWNDATENSLSDLDFDRLENIKYCDISVKNGNVLDLIIESCPKIKHLVLETTVVSIAPVTNLYLLTHLRLHNIDARKTNISCIFPVLGKNIIILSMQYIMNLNICNILLHCVNIHSLELEKCDFSNEQIQDLDDASLHFKSLKELTLISNTEIRWYYESLYNYKNLKEIYIANMRYYSDYYFTLQLVRNGFSNLERFVVRQCGDLEFGTALLIIRNCQHLKEMGCYSEWNGISDGEIHRLFYIIQNGNFAVTLTNRFHRKHYFN